MMDSGRHGRAGLPAEIEQASVITLGRRAGLQHSVMDEYLSDRKCERREAMGR